LTVCPLYIVEVAPLKSTGFFGTIHQLCVAFGFVLLSLVLAWINWKACAIVGYCITAVLSCLIWLVPETAPTDLASAESHEAKGVDVTICTPAVFCQLVICCLLMLFQQLSGINAILTNLKGLLKEARASGVLDYAGAISSSAQVIACAVAGILIQKFGRKVIWVISFGGIAITDIFYGVTEVPNLKNRKEKKIPAWVPIIVIFVNLFCFGVGAGPIPWFIVPELFESSVRSLSCTIVSVTNWVFTFGILMGFDSVKRTKLGLWGCMFIFGAVSVVSTIFGFVYVKAGTIEERTEGYVEADKAAPAEIEATYGPRMSSSGGGKSEPLIENKDL
jgi:MFS family permease